MRAMAPAPLAQISDDRQLLLDLRVGEATKLRCGRGSNSRKSNGSSSEALHIKQ